MYKEKKTARQLITLKVQTIREIGIINYLMIDAMIALMHSHKKVIISGHVIIP